MHRIVGLLGILAASGAIAGPIDGYAPVTAERLLHPEPRNWLMYRGDYAGWGYSALDQITVDNVADLTPAWALATGVTEGHEAPPIVNDGVMLVTTPLNQVIAIDAASGALIWRYRHELPADLRQLHPTNRGVALWADKIYMATVDARLVALDGATGEPVWDVAVGDYRQGYYMTMAPLIVAGKVMIGVSGGDFGVRGFVQAFDAGTGASLWKTYTIPAPGEPGHDTWPDDDSWQRGGGAVWITGHYDPELDLTYWGTGNAAPWMGDARPGDNLYTAAVVAIAPETGALVAHHQFHWNGSWDWDEAAAPLLVDVARGGRTIRGLVHAGRDGYLWLLERGADRIDFVAAWPFVRQNVFTRLDPATGRPEYDPARKPGIGRTASFCPSVWGGKDWPPSAYSPRTRLLYVPANDNLCSTFEGVRQEYRPGQLYTGLARNRLAILKGADHVGELQAWDLARGERAWTHEFATSQNWGPVLATAGDLVFAGGTNDRDFRAFDARTGEVLWRFRTNSGIIGVPVTYQVDGVQYVAVQSGWGVDAQRKQQALAQLLGYQADVPQGGVVWAFALKR